MATNSKPGRLKRAGAKAKNAAKSAAKSAANKARDAKYAKAVKDVAKTNAKNAKKNASTTASATAGSSSRGSSSASSDMGLDFLRGLIEAVDQSGIDYVEIDRDGTKVKISKTPPAAPVAAAAPAPAVHHAPQHAPAPAAAAAAPAATAAAPAAEAPKSNLIDVKSPMVGTFYRSPAPEAPSYVELGSSVTKGQTLCILEAMKLMNELESEVEGVVREILVDNADPVEYGQVLFRVEPSSR